MAFGTGSHETTTMCLAAVEEALSGTDASGASGASDASDVPDTTIASDVPDASGDAGSLLDLGTGTGILAIAGVKLGASFVTAVEYDEDGLAAARGNIAQNDTTDRITLIGGDVTDAAVQAEIISANGGKGYDVIAANIHRGLLIKIMPDLARMIGRGGRLILSGLLEADEAAMIEAMQAAGFTENRIIRKGEWLAICADFL
jgi:ribosomal protein L11 methyltransferase